jgi:putative tryptophan/tyrosine transport system substrate-binding protein
LTTNSVHFNWRPPLVRLLGKSVIKFAFAKSTIILALTVVTAWFPAEAQQPPPKLYRIGFLRAVACIKETDLFLGLRELGYNEGQNLVIECRTSFGKGELPDLAAELVRLNIDVLVSEGTKTTLAAKQATKVIPIVMVYVGDPLASGIANSLARPGGNVTGLSANLNEIIAKYLEILKEAAPRISRVALLMDSTNLGQTLLAEQLDAAARVMGMRVHRLDVLTPAALDGSFAVALRERAEAFIVLPLPSLGPTDVRRITEFALNNRLLTITYNTAYFDTGMLMLYGPNIPDQYRRVGSYVDKILKGARPADLPIQQPTKIDFIINQRTARAIRVKIPESLLERADQIIN